MAYQAVVIKDDADPVGIVEAGSDLLRVLPCFQAVFCSKTIIPDSEEHLFACFRRPHHTPSFGGLGLRARETSQHSGSLD